MNVLAGGPGGGVGFGFAADGGFGGGGYHDEGVGGAGLALAGVAVVVADDEGGCLGGGVVSSR